VHPNPDQQATQSGPAVQPIAHPPTPAQVAAIERLKEQALANHVPPNGRQSKADVNTTANPVAAPAPTLKAPDNGFDWGDAAIGAGIIATLALLITAGSIAVRQRSQPGHP
jgi:hypothetical protein